MKGYHCMVIPNMIEAKRLCERVGVSISGDGGDGGGVVQPGERAREVLKRLGGMVVLEKARKDDLAIDTTGDVASLKESKIGLRGGPKSVRGLAFDEAQYK